MSSWIRSTCHIFTVKVLFERSTYRMKNWEERKQNFCLQRRRWVVVEDLTWLMVCCASHGGPMCREMDVTGKNNEEGKYSNSSQLNSLVLVGIVSCCRCIMLSSYHVVRFWLLMESWPWWRQPFVWKRESYLWVGAHYKNTGIPLFRRTGWRSLFVIENRTCG